MKVQFQLAALSMAAVIGLAGRRNGPGAYRCGDTNGYGGGNR